MNNEQWAINNLKSNECLKGTNASYEGLISK